MNTIMIDIDNTLGDYTRALRDYVRECGRSEDKYPCPDPIAYGFDRTRGWPFTGEPDGFRWWHKRAVAAGLYAREEPYRGAGAALELLRHMGWRLIIATSRGDDRRGETIRWLSKHDITHDGLYMGDKTLLTPNVIIDDDPHILAVMHDRGVRAWHPGHAYCKDAPGETFAYWASVPMMLGHPHDE